MKHIMDGYVVLDFTVSNTIEEQVSCVAAAAAAVLLCSRTNECRAMKLLALANDRPRSHARATGRVFVFPYPNPTTKIYTV